MPDSMGSSLPNSAPSEPSQNGAKGLVIAIIVIVALAVAAYFIFSSGSSSNKVRPGSSTVGPTAPTNQTGETPAQPQVPNEVYSYVGEVTEVGNGQITVLAKKELNLLAADTTLTVKADANTQVIKRSIPRVLPADGGANLNLFKQENISLSDIAVGNQVTVVSPTNIRGVTEFTASRIEVLNVQ